jgi:hypothetical protein
MYEANFYISVGDNNEKYMHVKKNSISPSFAVIFGIMLQNISKEYSQDIIFRINKKNDSANYFDCENETFFFCAKNQKMIINSRLFFETNYILPESDLFGLDFDFLNNFYKGATVDIKVLLSDDGVCSIYTNNRILSNESSKLVLNLTDEIGKYLIISAEKSNMDAIYLRIPINKNHRSRIITTDGKFSHQDDMLSFLDKEDTPLV